MSKYLFEYRPDLFWNWLIINDEDKTESYVISSIPDAVELLEFLENKNNEETPDSIKKIIKNSFTMEEIMSKKREKVIYWVVDVQNDFMKPDGALYVKDAEQIIPNIVSNIKKFKTRDVTKIFTMDLHFENSEEISKNPDFITKFPNHCMADTEGAMLIDEVAELIYPVDVDVIDWMDFYNYQDLCEIAKCKTIILSKDKFDIFTGNQYVEKLLEIIKPDVVYVSGVASNVCVNYAVLGLLERGIKVNVITNTIKELPNLPLSPIIDKWVSAGAVLV